MEFAICDGWRHRQIGLVRNDCELFVVSLGVIDSLGVRTRFERPKIRDDMGESRCSFSDGHPLNDRKKRIQAVLGDIGRFSRSRMALRLGHKCGHLKGGSTDLTQRPDGARRVAQPFPRDRRCHVMGWVGGPAFSDGVAIRDARRQRYCGNRRLEYYLAMSSRLVSTVPNSVPTTQFKLSTKLCDVLCVVTLLG